MMLHPLSDSNEREEKLLKVAEKDKNHEPVDSQVWIIV